MENIENIVTDLKTSEELYNAGIYFPETVFGWIRHKEHGDKVILKSHLPAYEKDIPGIEFFPAPMTDEILDILPRKIVIGEDIYYFCLVKGVHHWIANYFTQKKGKIVRYMPSVRSSDNKKFCVSQICLWCKKEGYLCK